MSWKHLSDRDLIRAVEATLPEAPSTDCASAHTCARLLVEGQTFTVQLMGVGFYRDKVPGGSAAIYGATIRKGTASNKVRTA
ncbi:MAG: hypothetical protein ACOYLQ_18985, partial [Hyphomicrobiaceae bacterium]